MKKLIYILIPLLTTVLLSGCNPENESQTVSGTIENASGETIRLMGFTNGQADTLASQVLTDDGSFSFPVAAGILSFYSLTVDGKGNIVLAFDSTQSPVITADLNTMKEDYKVEGSKDSKALRDLYVETIPFEKELDSLKRKLQTAAKTRNTADRIKYSSAYNEAREAYRAYLISQIEEDSTSIAGFSILQRLDPNADLAYFISVRNGLAPRLEGNFFFDQLSKNVAQLEAQKRAAAKFEPGNVAPDIVLPNPEGKKVALSSLRGDYVLIDFWASWCKPCRAENPNVVRMYNKYAKDNFEIYGVSLDRNRAHWLKAIEDDHLSWIHVSDLKYWNSAAAKLYNIRSIPHTVLIDPDGIIIANKLRGPSLEKKLKEIFGH